MSVCVCGGGSIQVSRIFLIQILLTALFNPTIRPLRNKWRSGRPIILFFCVSVAKKKEGTHTGTCWKQKKI